MKIKNAVAAAVALSISATFNPASSSAAPARSHHGHVATVKKSTAHGTRHKHHTSRRGLSHRHHAHRSTAGAFAGGSSNQFGFGSMSTFGGSDVVAEARRFIGSGNPTGRARLWCARFMNMVLERSGHRGTGSDMARSFASYGQRVSGPQVGAIAVMSRGRRGGHVGVVSGIDSNGNPIVVSGNHNRRVAEAVYPKTRIYAYVMPN